MNKELVLRVADAIEAESLANFSMGTWSCGTSACIAGHAVMLHDGVSCSKLRKLTETKDSTNANWLTYVPSRAEDVLGLTERQAADLFLGPSGATPQRAAEVLRDLAETGEVRW